MGVDEMPGRAAVTPPPAARGVVAAISECARILGAVLAEIDDPDSEMTASAATRRRIEGATAALASVQREVTTKRYT